MATFSYHHLLIFTLVAVTSAAPSFRPKALVLPVSKDPSKLQYTINLTQRTPPVSVPLTLHLGGSYLWVDCDRNYVSSTYRPAQCNSAQCSLADSKSCGTCNSPPRPGCNNDTCGLTPDNPITNTATGGELASDVVQLPSTDGSNPGRVVSVPNFLFTCGPTFLLQGLAKGVQGIAGLGRTKISLPSQFSSTFSFARKFAICLSASTNLNGVVFFGDGPYRLLHSPQSIDVSSSLMYTPLIINPVSTAAASFAGEPSSEYFIGVTAIKIGEKEVPLNKYKALLTIDNKGNGGTKISTVNPYTVMHTSIYKAVTNFFVNELKNVSRVKAVAPFQVCYDMKSLPSTRVGAGVPAIDLVLQNEKVYWRMFGANSMVAVNGDVICLGFLDGGENVRTAIVIGGYQMEDNLLQFDLARSRLGFSSSLLFSQTTCANFNFTSSA
ncbi:basic 7S globulin-like [Chenopodium quinoa]|uniref:basic 7S globulin-like n=1 Tax=Chenopodium quinoa TaxID=63459 RepID=UPI000B7743E8|nr:basic 7S globulin-like [Chenopodium quinoa]